MTGRWTKEKAWQWYNERPWIRGCNYMSADCANRIDQWQSHGFEERFKTTEEELALEIVKVKEEVLKYILGNVGLSPDQFETLEEYNAEVDAYRDLMIENYGEQYFRDNAIYEYSMDRVRGLVTVNYK